MDAAGHPRRPLPTKSSTKYCLRSPLSTAAAQYVVVVTCPTGTLPANLTWTVSGDTGTYATSYRIIDGAGYCLQPPDPDASPADLFASGYKVSKIVVATYTASTRAAAAAAQGPRREVVTGP